VDLIERAKVKGRFDFVKDVAAWLPLIMIGDMLGVDPNDYPRLLHWSEAMINGTGATSEDRLIAAGVAFEEYTAYQRRVLEDRRRNPSDDLISILVHAEVDGERLTDDELIMESLLILIGGDETTRHVLTGGMHQLLLHPDQRAAVAADPAAKLPTAIEEMLRWVSPIQNMARTASRDVELRGETIREGQKVILLYPSANRDAKVFADPFRFDVARKPNDHIAFGLGGHFCLGSNLARLELRVFFEDALRRLPNLELASSDPPPLRPSNFVSGIESLPVVC
jgi:cholest-4-en-3-one 26-monooxygenase